MEKILNLMKEKLKNEKVLVACSTGVDSMVLLHLVQIIKSNDEIVVAHVNHQKREQSKIEETYIKQFCDSNKIKCHIKKLPHIDEGNFQSQARELRYQFFEEIAEKEEIKYILLAHHADDNLETIIMRLLKSSSLKGYAGMEKETVMNKYHIYRPLLTISKAEIKEYALLNNIKYFEDESNSTLDYTRNRIRHLIIPNLKQENPNIYEAINYFSETILNANEIVEKQEFTFIENKILVNNNDNRITYKIKQSDYFAISSFLQRQILFRILKKYQLSHQCINDIQKQLSSSKKKIVTQVNNDIAMIKEYDMIIFTEENLESMNFYLEIIEEGCYDLPNNGKITINKNNCYFQTTNNKVCYNIESLPIIIRSRQAGDKIKNKLVSDILTNKKIPYLLRKDICLLCDKQNNILAILGYKGGK